jgi:hypothetical protein
MKRVFAIGMVSLTLAVALSAAPDKWPNLDVLRDKGFPKDKCGLSGKDDADSAKGKHNALKNRYHIPVEGDPEPLTWDAMMALPIPPPRLVRNSERALKVSVRMADVQRYVSFTGYVGKVTPSKSENCNCDAKPKRLADTHIDVFPSANDIEDKSQRVVVEVQQRCRVLARAGVLKAANMLNPNDWSHENLKQLEGKWVRFDGWLLYDAEHYLEDFQTDPQDRFTERGVRWKPSKPDLNWRATCWEVHPVLGIEILATHPKP